MATSTQNLTKKVLAQIQQCLNALGFSKRAKHQIFVTRITSDVIGMVGLNKAIGHGDGILEINPVVGVRNQQIERLVAELDNEPFNELLPATLAGNIGYLSPENKYLPFLFNEATAIEMVADKLCKTVEAYGIQFMKKVADLATLVDAMTTTRFRINEVVNYRIPVGLYLLNKREQAKEFLDAQLTDIGNRNDPAAIRYKNFATELQTRLNK